MQLRNQTILIISNEKWDGIWYSKHHYAHELAKSNQVYFVDPPIAFSFYAFFRKKVSIHTINNTLQVVRYANYLPWTGKSKCFFRINEWLISKRIRRLLKNKKIIFWSFDPYRLVFPSWLGIVLSIYLRMDDYKNKTETLLAKNVDLILTVSPVLAKKFASSKTIGLIPHAVAMPHNLEENTLSTILLAGTLNHRVDFQTLLVLVEENENETFVIAGPLHQKQLSNSDKRIVEKLKTLKQVRFTGVVSYPELERHIAQAKLCLCLYKSDQRGNQIDSLKILQYLIQGKPIVTTYLSNYDTVERKKLIRMVKSPKEFINFANEQLSLTENSAIQKQRIHFAQQYSYEENIKLIERYIHEHKKPF